ncbi:MAG: 2-oxo acid dehydrogenase subunit E2 [Opitutae bacterium]|nr:2-oxo acid dehydrogenase subunit E2 [Opitutae bacterium]
MATIIEMPKLSDTMSVGTLVKWHKKTGDVVKNGDILAEVETDKATMDLENFDDGTLLEIFIEEGNEVPIGSALAAVGEPGEEISVPSNKNTPPSESDDDVVKDSEEKDKKDPVAGPETIVESTKEETMPPKATTEGEQTNRIKISPLAKKMALEMNIDFKKLQGSGPNGRITKKDILSNSITENIKPSVEEEIPSLKTLNTPKRESTISKSDTVVPVSKMRSIIAKRLLESKNTIPHFYLQKEINATPLKNARIALNLKLSKKNPDDPTKLTLNDIILKACAETIPLVPEINSSWEEKGIKLHGGVHLAFGVAVEDGLLTPVVRNAEQLGLETLSIEAKSLISKARSKKLSPDEMTGSTFTVTNLGMFGIDFFSGIINPPNAAILSVGGIVQKPIVDTMGNIQSGETMMLGLSCDHRLVDGAVGASFLQLLAETLESPASMLV